MKEMLRCGLILLVVTAFVTAVGCNDKEKATIPISDVNVKIPSSAPEQQSEETAENESLTELYQKIEAEQAFCAVSYLGYTEGPLGDGYQGWFEENEMLEIYPFLAEVSEDRIIEQDGGEVYCIIPKQDVVDISVYAQDIGSDGAASVGELLFLSTDSQPFIVRGNISEIVPNTLVRLEYEDHSVTEFSPALSGMDGRLILEELPILDISVYLYRDVGMIDDVYYWEEENVEGSWICQALSNEEGESLIANLEFYPDENKRVVFWYGLDYDNITAYYEGTYYESDIPADPPKIMMELNLTDGSEVVQNSGQTLQMVVNLKNWYTDDGLDVIHLEGDPLLPGLENVTVYFERTYG